MDPDLLFSICNNAVIPFWILLAVAPGWIWTQRLVHSLLVPAVLGVVYIVALAVAPTAEEGASFFSLAGVMAFFRVPEAVLAGWVHYLVFDLFVGAWEVRDARRRDISHWLVVPCLVFTLMFGPVGLLLYLMLRAALRKTTTLVEA